MTDTTEETPPTDAPTTLRVEIWSDVVCPWCYIGKRRFETALERFRQESDVEVEVEYKAFMLDPGPWPSPSRSRRSTLASSGTPPPTSSSG